MKELAPYRGTLLRLAVVNTLLMAGVAAVLILIDPSRRPGTAGALIDETASSWETSRRSADQQTLIPEDRQFVLSAAQLAGEEVRLAELGAQRVSAAVLRTFAREVAAEQIAARNEIETLAAKKGVLLPTGERNSPAAERLAAASGAQVDDAFIEGAATVRASAFRLFQEAARDGHDPELRAFAGRMLPRLEAEHEKARRLKRTLF